MQSGFYDSICSCIIDSDFESIEKLKLLKAFQSEIRRIERKPKELKNGM